MRRLLAVLAVPLLLTACGSEEGGEEAQAPVVVPTTEAPAPPEEVGVADAHQWPDGLTATVTAVRTEPAASPEGADDTDVYVTVTLGNEGADTLPFGADPNALDAGPHTDLLYGVNPTQAQRWFYDQNRLPTQLAPGTTAEWTGYFSMPGADLGALALTVTPTDAHDPVTFTGLEELVG